MNLNNIELAILIKGRPITEYRHKGQTFVEGRAGSEYEIEIRNRHHTRVEAVLSVDGLSVIDGKSAGPQSTGYLIEVGNVLRIPGWMIDNKTIAKFAFSGHDQSYTQLSDEGDPTNNGVIGIMAFSEKPQLVMANYNSRFYQGSRGIAPSGGAMSKGAWGGSSSWNMVEQNTSGGILNPTVNCSVGATGSIGPSGSTGVSCSYQPDQSFLMESQSMAPTINYLGTSFGEAADFRTMSVEFDRGDMLSYQVLYYDDIRGLRARGVVTERRRQKKIAPNAFPAMPETGCKLPRNWRR